GGEVEQLIAVVEPVQSRLAGVERRRFRLLDARSDKPHTNLTGERNGVIGGRHVYPHETRRPGGGQEPFPISRRRRKALDFCIVACPNRKPRGTFLTL